MIKAAVLTLSDKGVKGERLDRSGPIVERLLKKIDAQVISRDILPDEKTLIRRRLIRLCRDADLIITTGGTGLSWRDVTPDATMEVIQREIPGLAEAMRYEGMRKTPYAMLSRAVAGVRGQTLIINLPGSPSGVKDNLSVILDSLPHAVEKIKGSRTDCVPVRKHHKRVKR